MQPNGSVHLDAEITIRRAASPADYRACQEAQRKAWGITDESYIIPIATMVGANLHGGLVLGAFLADGSAVGVSFSFLGRLDDRICLYSQLTGVVPAYQSRGLGHAIKLVQRHFAHAEGLSLIAWAFDPLQSGNAHFNLNRLGARARRYVEAMYGDRTDALFAGVPTDRLIAEWEIDEPPAPEQEPCVADTKSLTCLVRADRDSTGALVPVQVVESQGEPRVLLEIPERVMALRRDHHALAGVWHRAVRQAFQQSFAAGYRAIGLVRDGSAGQRRCYYLLERRAP